MEIILPITPKITVNHQASPSYLKSLASILLLSVEVQEFLHLSLVQGSIPGHG